MCLLGASDASAQPIQGLGTFDPRALSADGTTIIGFDPAYAWPPAVR